MLRGADFAATVPARRVARVAAAEGGNGGISKRSKRVSEDSQAVAAILSETPDDSSQQQQTLALGGKPRFRLVSRGLRRRNPAECLPVVPGAAADQQVHFALVRRVPAVWTTCMLFFQIVLFAGYAYAHLWQPAFAAAAGVVQWRCCCWPGDRRCCRSHPATRWKPTDSDAPTWRILLLLGGDRGAAVLRALDHQPAGPGVVQPQLSRAARPTGFTRCRTSARWWPC